MADNVDTEVWRKKFFGLILIKLTKIILLYIVLL